MQGPEEIDRAVAEGYEKTAWDVLADVTKARARGRRFDLPTAEVVQGDEEPTTKAAVIIRETPPEEPPPGPRNRREKRLEQRAKRRARMRKKRRACEGRKYCGK